MDQFNLITDFESLLLSEMDIDDHETDLDRCKVCNVQMSVDNNKYICRSCGLVDERVDVVDMASSTDVGYSSIGNNIRCIGQHAQRYQSIMRTRTKSNENTHDANVETVLFAFNYNIGKDMSPPKQVLLNVLEQYKHMKIEGTLYRGSTLRGILAALVYYECLKQKLLFKPSDIYTWYNIDSNTFSKGDKRVRELLDHGFMLEDLREINLEESYLYGFAKQINVPDEHYPLLHQLMTAVTDQRILNPNSKASTRALCVLHLYVCALGLNVQTDQFKDLFRTNYGTIRSSAVDLFQHREDFIPIFKSHGISIKSLVLHTEKTKKISKQRKVRVNRIELD